MTIEYNVLAPGPVNLHPRVRNVLSLPMIHHRTPEFDQILKRTLQRLKKVFYTKQDVFILTSTGSGGMEALLVNTLEKGDKVLLIESGKFGERWGEMVKAFGGVLHTLSIPWGEAVSVEQVQTFLNQNPDTKIVLCQACETSTAVAHPIQALAKVIQNYSNTLFLVDAITALGAYPIYMDDWGIDGLVAGSQKAFMLPTGLSLISFSEKAWKKIQNVTTPRFYFDVRKEKKANQNGETFFSSNVSLIRALDEVLNIIEETGIEKLFRMIQERSEMTRHLGQKLGFTLFVKSKHNLSFSPSVTALFLPSPNDFNDQTQTQYDGQKIRSLLESKYFITIMGGQDQAKGKILRIGHMGHISITQMQDFFEKLYLTIQELYPNWKLMKFSDWQLEIKNYIQINLTDKKSNWDL
jgi:aspartate aminotransferase-like enzyme